MAAGTRVLRFYSGRIMAAQGSGFVAAEIVHNNDVARPELRDEVAARHRRGSIRHSSARRRHSGRRADRSATHRGRLAVREWPCGAKPRRRSPLRLPIRAAETAMFVLIQVSSMKTRRRGSRSALPRSPALAVGGRRPGRPAQGRTVFFLKRSPSRRRNIHTALCETVTPRAPQFVFQRDAASRCGVCLIRSTMNARCGSFTGLRCPPILPGATEPVAR